MLIDKNYSMPYLMIADFIEEIVQEVDR